MYLFIKMSRSITH